jgi:hypothetical protein
MSRFTSATLLSSVVLLLLCTFAGRAATDSKSEAKKADGQTEAIAVKLIREFQREMLSGMDTFKEGTELTLEEARVVLDPYVFSNLNSIGVKRISNHAGHFQLGLANDYERTIQGVDVHFKRVIEFDAMRTTNGFECKNIEGIVVNKGFFPIGSGLKYLSFEKDGDYLVIKIGIKILHLITSTHEVRVAPDGKIKD